LKDRIGVCLQATNLPPRITLREALQLFGSFYSRTVDGDALLKRLQLWDKRDGPYEKLSGGQKQRLALALALINDPQMLFLDEPSAGLDPQARLEIHDLVQQLRREQRTILLTTHYIEEAEKLCDRVAIVDEGRIVAMGTPDAIRSRTLGHARVEIRCGQPLPAIAVPRWPDVDAMRISDDRQSIVVETRNAARTVVDLVRWIDQHGIELADVHVKRPSLEDVFIELTGKSLRE
jgi:ABC-2 type transport system ATP-binding protein